METGLYSWIFFHLCIRPVGLCSGRSEIYTSNQHEPGGKEHLMAEKCRGLTGRFTTESVSLSFIIITIITSLSLDTTVTLKPVLPDASLPPAPQDAGSYHAQFDLTVTLRDDLI